MHSSDLVVVGAGIIGLAHAAEAVHRGLSVQIIERDTEAVGASVRNFGHACITAQDTALVQIAQRSRRGWLRTAELAGFWAPEAGAIVLARSAAEAALLEEFRDARGEEAVRLLTADETRSRLSGPDRPADPDIVGAAWLPADLRVDPRSTVAAIADWLAAQPEVRFHWRTTALGCADGVVHTSRGEVRGRHVVVCVGHDLDRLYPVTAEENDVLRCRLQMALVDAPTGYTQDAAVLTGTSMLRYGGMAGLPSATAVRTELEHNNPELLALGANLMFTRRPDGSLLVGDSHHYGITADPFIDEQVSEHLLAGVARILGVDRLRVLQRWQGVYASSARTDILRAEHGPNVSSVTVTTGLGMTLAFGLAAQTLDAL
ncbi:TIGR03364 family FAD-dependent oxidoreductase [Mycobacterium sp. NPDC003323]